VRSYARSNRHLVTLTILLAKENLQPCIAAENQVIERCKHIPTSMCVEDPNTIPDIIFTHPDACLGDYTEVLEKFENGIQPICSSDFQP